MTITTTTLDRIINGTRYRSARPFDASPYRTQYNHGVRQVRVWPCRDVMILESDSQWYNGHKSRILRVLDPRTPAGRDQLQGLADNWAQHCDGDRDPGEEIRALIRRFAPTAER